MKRRERLIEEENNGTWEASPWKYLCDISAPPASRCHFQCDASPMPVYFLFIWDSCVVSSLSRSKRRTSSSRETCKFIMRIFDFASIYLSDGSSTAINEINSSTSLSQQHFVFINEINSSTSLSQQHFLLNSSSSAFPSYILFLSSGFLYNRCSTYQISNLKEIPKKLNKGENESRVAPEEGHILGEGTLTTTTTHKIRECFKIVWESLRGDETGALKRRLCNF